MAAITAPTAVITQVTGLLYHNPKLDFICGQLYHSWPDRAGEHLHVSYNGRHYWLAIQGLIGDY